ncbi:MAG: hypothetical protein JWQ50_5609 [Caballeronia mineralivorans]|nr:hypothetical protein [Caballeronia mineralivorans]MEA3097595.1 hypothetical protein [Caballeronia mineralivorans]
MLDVNAYCFTNIKGRRGWNFLRDLPPATLFSLSTRFMTCADGRLYSPSSVTISLRKPRHCKFLLCASAFVVRPPANTRIFSSPISPNHPLALANEQFLTVRLQPAEEDKATQLIADHLFDVV